MNIAKISSSREQSQENIPNEHNIQNALSNNIQGASNNIQCVSNNIPCAHELLPNNVSSSLAERRVIESKNVTQLEFKLLIKNGTLSNNVHYVVDNTLYLIDIPNLHNLPDYVTAKGGVDIRGCNDLIYLSKTLVVEESIEIEGCNNLEYIANHLTINIPLCQDSCHP